MKRLVHDFENKVRYDIHILDDLDAARNHFKEDIKNFDVIYVNWFFKDAGSSFRHCYDVFRKKEHEKSSINFFEVAIKRIVRMRELSFRRFKKGFK